jgi:hypothetical protein
MDVLAYCRAMTAFCRQRAEFDLRSRGMGQIDIRVREPATPKSNLANRFGFGDCVIALAKPTNRRTAHAKRPAEGHLVAPAQDHSAWPSPLLHELNRATRFDHVALGIVGMNDRGKVPSDVHQLGSAQSRQLGAVGLGHQGWRGLNRFAVGLGDAVGEEGRNRPMPLKTSHASFARPVPARRDHLIRSCSVRLFHHFIPSSSSLVIANPIHQGHHLYHALGGAFGQGVIGRNRVMILDRRRMVAKLSDVVQRLNLLVPADWVTAVDQWRSHQPGVPNRSEAIRRLVLEALEAGAKGAKPKGKPKG